MQLWFRDAFCSSVEQMDIPDLSCFVEFLNSLGDICSNIFFTKIFLICERDWSRKCLFQTQPGIMPLARFVIFSELVWSFGVGVVRNYSCVSFIIKSRVSFIIISPRVVGQLALVKRFCSKIFFAFSGIIWLVSEGV